MQHDKRFPRHSRAENCQQSDILKHLGEAGNPKVSVKRIEQKCRRQLCGQLLLVKCLCLAKKSIAAGIAGCPLFLEGSVA